MGKTMFQLVKQNHTTLEKTLSSVRDKTITFLDNHFFSSTRQFAFWTGIETLSEVSEADIILDRWSSDGTEYALYMLNAQDKILPFDMPFKERGVIYTKGSFGYLSWAEQALQEKGAGAVRLTKSDSGSTVTFTRSILHPEKYGESVGFLVVSKLEVLLTKDLMTVQLPENASIYLFNDQEELLMRVGKEDLPLTAFPEAVRNHTSGYYFANKGSTQWLYAYSHNSVFNTRLIYQIPLDSITGNQTVYQWIIMVMSAIYMLFVLFFVLYLLRSIVKPLARLVTFTKLYEPGKKFDFGSYPSRLDEFGLLYEAFLRMTRRLDQSVEENYVIKIKQKEMELSALHSQITPHLLYNTLDSIYWYAVDSGNMDVGSMVKDLSRLLRIGLSKGKSIITIEEELEHVQAYVRLQMKRYPDTFEIFWDIDEAVKAYMTPKVILQPLVENAIFHGVNSMDGEGFIWIRIKRNREEIQMIVEDNGFISVDILKLELIVHGETNDKGYGIRNVHQRIQLHFGESYGLRYDLREGGGLVATIKIPLQENE